MSGYTIPAGSTVSLTNNSKSISVSGANWYLLGVSANATLRVNGRNVTVASVPSSGAPQLASNWPDFNVVNATYELYSELDAETFSTDAKQFLAMAGQVFPHRIVDDAGLPFSPDYYNAIYLKGIGATAPPANPFLYDAYFVGSSPTGAWTGKSGKVAFFSGVIWRFCTPYNGMSAYDVTNRIIVVYSAGAWVDTSSDPTIQDRLDAKFSSSDFAVSAGVRPEDYSATAGSGGDDTAALQWAINQGGRVLLGAKTYNFTCLTIPAPIMLTGQGGGLHELRTRLVCTAATSTDKIVVGNGYALIDGVHIRDITFEAPYSTGGSLLFLNWVMNSEISNFMMISLAATTHGIKGTYCNTIWVNHGRITHPTSAGIYFYGVEATRSDCLYVDNLTVEGDSMGAGTHVPDAVRLDGAVHTFVGYNLNFVTCGRGLYLLNGVGMTTRAEFVQIYAMNVDYPKYEAVRVEYHDGVYLTDCYLHGSLTTYNVVVSYSASNSVSNIQFRGGNCSGAYKSGMYLDGTSILVDGMALYANSNSGAGTYHGVEIGPHSYNVRLIGVQSGTVQGFVGATQGYGVKVNAGAQGYQIDGSCDLSGNVTGAVQDLSNQQQAWSYVGAIVSAGAGATFVVSRRDTGAMAWDIYSSAGEWSLYNRATSSGALTVSATNAATFASTLRANGSFLCDSTVTATNYYSQNSAFRIGYASGEAYIDFHKDTGVIAIGSGDSLTVTATGAKIGGNVVWHAGNDGASSGCDADLLDGNHGSYFLAWANFTGVPSTFTPATHSHAIADTTGLQTALDAKLASTSYTAADILTKISTVDGSSSGLDADLLDGLHASAFAQTGGSVTFSGDGRFYATGTRVVMLGTDDTHALRLLYDGNAHIDGTNGSLWINASYGGNVLMCGGGGALVINGTDPGTYRFLVNGTAGGTSWTNTSDARLKSDVRPIDDAGDLIANLKAYRGKKQGKEGFFLIAQEVEKVTPELVQEGPVWEGYGDDPIKSIESDGLIPIIIQVVQNLQVELAALKARDN